MSLVLPGMQAWEPGRQTLSRLDKCWGGPGGGSLSPESIHHFLSNGCAHQLWLPTFVIFLCYKLDDTACGQGAISRLLKRNFLFPGP